MSLSLEHRQSDFGIQAELTFRNLNSPSAIFPLEDVLGLWRVSLRRERRDDQEHLSLYFEPTSRKANSSFADLFPLSARIVTRLNTDDVLAETTSIVKATNSQIIAANLLPQTVVLEVDDILRISINIKPHKDVRFASSVSRAVPAGHLVAETLRSMLKGEDVVDTKFVLYSRRAAPSDSGDGNGATRPRAVFANSGMLASVSEYFQTLLTGEFAESGGRDFEEQPQNSIYHYDYPSDSDLDTDSEDGEGANEEPASGHPMSTAVGDAQEEDQTASARPGSQPPAASMSTAPVKIGKVVNIKDTAHRTWEALLFYLYTSEISFAPLKSIADSPRDRRAISERGPSAKSMYRLADKLGLEGLAALSLEHIRSQITTANVLEEVFSNFTSRYPTVREMELTFALSHWDTLKASSALEEKVLEVAQGERPYAGKVLLELLSGRL